VFDVDVASGVQSVLSQIGTTVGLGGLVRDAVFQAWDGGVYAVTGYNGEWLTRIDAATGRSSPVASQTAGRGPGPGTRSSYYLDAAPATGVAYVSDELRKLVAVDLVTGERVVVAR
jgi:hypothetical protein